MSSQDRHSATDAGVQPYPAGRERRGRGDGAAQPAQLLRGVWPRVWSKGLLGALVLLGACGGSSRHYRMPPMSQGEDAVRVYYVGEKPECKYEELGVVDAASGDPDAPDERPGSIEITIALLKREAWKKGGNGLLLQQPTKSEDQAVVLGSGVAIKCQSHSWDKHETNKKPG